MPTSAITVFEEVSLNIGEGVHNLASDTLKLGIIDNTLTPAATDATPTWSDYSTYQVAVGSSYTGYKFQIVIGNLYRSGGSRHAHIAVIHPGERHEFGIHERLLGNHLQRQCGERRGFSIHQSERAGGFIVARLRL